MTKNSGGPLNKIMLDNGITQKVLTATILVFFSGVLIFFDEGGNFMYGIPRELIIPIYLIQISLAPLYLKKYKSAYLVGIIVAVFVAFTYRDATILARTIPILQYFLGFFSILAYREITEITKTK